jgi:site-specific DNA recombinase
MTHTYTKKGNRLYRYYVCNKAQQHGRQACPDPSVPAHEIEQFVVNEIKAIGRDPALVAATLAESRRLAGEAVQRLKRERSALVRQRRADEAELRELAAKPAQNGELAELAKVQERVGATERRLAEVGDEVSRWTNHDISESDVSHALAEFDTLWAALTPREHVQVLTLLIEQVDFDGQHGNIDITFRPAGIKTLACGVAEHEETAA